MERIYKLNADLANKACEILKMHPYYDVADILNEMARQDIEYDRLEAEEKTAQEAQPELPL
jgi:hypothetical protein